MIPGATVSAIESATGIKTDTVTGANGRYSFPSIRPTTYEIRAELTGFKTVRRTDITLQANQNLTVNITLELGDLAETITVAGETATVDISSATISEVVDHARIVELPIAGREIARLQTLVAGTVLASVSEETGKSIPGAVRISANGAGERQNAYRLDGANNTDPYFQENQSFPFPDALQEFSIQTSNYSASHGNNAGAVVNVVTRSGTNTFHGGAFEYLRDRKFNSKGFFAAEKDFLKRNQYGGFAGGPIRKNSTFFFGGWQRTRITNRASEVIRNVPTAAQRRGDFSNCTPACPQLYNPATGLPFPNNQIPADLWDPAAVKVFAALPTSNLPNGQVTVPRGTGQDSNQFIAKVDQQLGSNNQLSVRYFLDDFNNASQFLPENILSYTGPSLESDPRSQSIVTGWKRTMSSTLLNESTFGYNRLHTARRPHPESRPRRISVSGSLLPTHTVGVRDQGRTTSTSATTSKRRSHETDSSSTTRRTGSKDDTGSSSASSSNRAVRDLQRFRRAGHSSRTANTLARPVRQAAVMRSPISCSAGSARSITATANTRTIEISISHNTSRTIQLSDRVTLNFGARTSQVGPWHDRSDASGFRNGRVPERHQDDAIRRTRLLDCSSAAIQVSRRTARFPTGTTSQDALASHGTSRVTAARVSAEAAECSTTPISRGTTTTAA